MNQNDKIVLFQEKQIRRVWHDEQWYFAVVDVLAVLTESQNPSVYWRVLKKRLIDEGANETVSNCNGFKMQAADGKMRLTDCLNTQDLLRIIMSVPSPKAEPFKQWLAQVGRERIEEIENPELGIERIRETYLLKGYSKEWIDGRIKSIHIRKQLTDEWERRGVKVGQEYAILTSEISKATFGLTPSEYKDLKNLKKENLRDHMTNLELIFTMLGEEATRRIAVTDKAQGFSENHRAAQKGGESAGIALDNFEKTSGEKVITSDNFVQQIKSAQNKKPLQLEGDSE